MNRWIIKLIVLVVAGCFVTGSGPAQTPGPARHRCPTCGQLLPDSAEWVSAPAMESKSKVPLPLNLGIAVPLAALVAATVLYFLVLSPRKKRRLLLEAFGILERDEIHEFSRAEQLLNQALTVGLKTADIADARFALAYVRARLGQLAEAVAVMRDLATSGHSSRESIYLDLWLQSRLKNHPRVIEIYQEKASQLNDLLDTKLIVGIALLHHAKLLWARKDVDDALHYFEQLRRLEVLTEEIPQQIDDHQVIFGIVALFDKEVAIARQHFDNARETAQQANKPTVSAEIGQLLCEWRTTDAPSIDDALGRVIETLRAAPAPADAAKDNSGKDRPLDEPTLLLRNCLLWHAVSLLYVWIRRPERSDLPREEIQRLSQRLQAVKDIDPDMGDAYLIEGLVIYFFGHDYPELRQRGLELIEKAVDQDVNVPEVLVLLEREKKLDELYRDSLARYLTLVKEWLRDPGVPEQLRRELKERLECFERFRQMGEVDISKGAEDAAPSLADMQHRVVMLHKRVGQIVKPRLAKAGEKETGKMVDGLMEDLGKATKILGDDAERLETTEQRLMLVTGEFLLSEEEPAGDQAQPSAKEENENNGDENS